MKLMTVKEFREKGYLQEVNRLLLHPLGLALEVIIAQDGEERFGQVWDCREEEGGISFDGIDQAKVEYVEQEFEKRKNNRIKELGEQIQTK